MDGRYLSINGPGDDEPVSSSLLSPRTPHSSRGTASSISRPDLQINTSSFVHDDLSAGSSAASIRRPFLSPGASSTDLASTSSTSRRILSFFTSLFSPSYKPSSTSAPISPDKTRSCCLQTRLRRIMCWTLVSVLSAVLITAAVLGYQFWLLTKLSIHDTELVISDLCSRQRVEYGVHAAVHNPSHLGVTIGPAMLSVVSEDGDVQVLSAVLPSIDINHGDNFLSKNKLEVIVTNEEQFFLGLQQAANQASLRPFSLHGSLPIRIHTGILGTITLYKDVASLVRQSTSSSDDDDENLLMRVLRSGHVESTDFERASGDVYIRGLMGVSFDIKYQVQVHVPTLSLALMAHNPEDQKPNKVLDSEISSVLFGAGPADFNVTARVWSSGFDALKELANRVFYNRPQAQILVTGHRLAHDLSSSSSSSAKPALLASTSPSLRTRFSSLARQLELKYPSPSSSPSSPSSPSSSPVDTPNSICYLQHTLNQLVIPIRIPTEENGKPIVEVSAIHSKQVGDRSYELVTDVTLNSALMYDLRTPTLRLDVLYHDRPLGTLSVLPMQLDKAHRDYQPTLRIDLHAEYQDTLLAVVGDLASDDEDDDAADRNRRHSDSENGGKNKLRFTVRAADRADQFSDLAASLVEEISGRSLEFLHEWIVDILHHTTISELPSSSSPSTSSSSIPVLSPSVHATSNTLPATLNKPLKRWTRSLPVRSASFPSSSSSASSASSLSSYRVRFPFHNPFSHDGLVLRHAQLRITEHEDQHEASSSLLFSSSSPGGGANDKDNGLVRIEVDPNTEIGPDRSMVSFVLTASTGADFRHFFHKFFFGDKTALTLSWKASVEEKKWDDADPSAPSSSSSASAKASETDAQWLVRLPAHNYFKDVLRDIKVVPDFQHFDPTSGVCDITFKGLATAHNPLPSSLPASLSLTLSQAAFDVWMYDEHGAAGYPPLKDTLWVGTAKRTDDKFVETDEPLSVAPGGFAPVFMRLECHSIEVCMRLLGCLGRQEAFVDLRKGVLGLALGESSKEDTEAKLSGLQLSSAPTAVASSPSISSQQQQQKQSDSGAIIPSPTSSSSLQASSVYYIHWTATHVRVPLS